MRALRELPRLEVLHDLGGLSWPTAKLLLGVTHPRERDPAEPEFFFYLDIKAANQPLLDAKRRAVTDFLATLRADGLHIEDPSMSRRWSRSSRRWSRWPSFPPDSTSCSITPTVA